MIKHTVLDPNRAGKDASDLETVARRRYMMPVGQAFRLRGTLVPPITSLTRRSWRLYGPLSTGPETFAEDSLQHLARATCRQVRLRENSPSILWPQWPAPLWIS
jgi:hypothetical protein